MFRRALIVAAVVAVAVVVAVFPEPDYETSSFTVTQGHVSAHVVVMPSNGVADVVVTLSGSGQTVTSPAFEMTDSAVAVEGPAGEFRLTPMVELHYQVYGYGDMIVSVIGHTRVIE